MGNGTACRLRRLDAAGQSRKLLLNVLQRRIQGVRDLGIGFGTIHRQPGRQIAIGKTVGKLSEEGRSLGAIGSPLFGQRPLVADPQFVEAKRYGNLDIDHHEPHD